MYCSSIDLLHTFSSSIESLHHFFYLYLLSLSFTFRLFKSKPTKQQIFIYQLYRRSNRFASVRRRLRRLRHWRRPQTKLLQQYVKAMHTSPSNVK